MTTIETIDTLDAKIDEIHDQYAKTSPAYRTISTLNKHLFSLLKPETRAESRDSIKELLEAHQDQPALHQNMLEIVELFIGMVDAMRAA